MTNQLMEVFEERSSELYSLAFLLTGSADRSVEAFNRALDFDRENPVFGKFMNAWARKLVVVEALDAMRAELRLSAHRVARAAEDDTPADANWKRRPNIPRDEFDEAVAAIDSLPRCAMLLTTFEGMSMQAASVLLNQDKSLTRKAQRMGLVQLTRHLAGGRDSRREPGLHPVPVLQLG